MKATAAELLRQRLKDRLLGRKGLLAEARRNVKSLTPAAIAESPGDAVPATAEVLDLVAKLKRLSLKTIAELEENGPEFVDRTATRIETVVSLIVEPELRDAVLSQQVLVEQWPLPWLLGAPRVTLILHGSLAKAVEASSEALQWARQRLPDNMRRWAYVPDDDDKNLVVPFDAVGPSEAGATHSAWQAARTLAPCAPRGYLLDVTRPTVRTLTVLTGTDAGKLRDAGNGAELPDAIVFHWPDGGQLELFRDSEYYGDPLLAVARQYGPVAVRFMHYVYFLNWVQRARANEAVWLWPNEIHEAFGLSASKENRETTLGILTDLHRSVATWHYPHGKPITAPVLACTATDTVARRVMLHPGLYRGVMAEDGALGTYFWLMPPKLLSASVRRNADRVHTLAALAGGSWRAAVRDGEVHPAVFTARLLAEGLDIRGRLGQEDDGTRRRTDERAAGSLRTTLDSGIEVGLLSGWSIRRGRLEDLSAVLELHCSTEAADLVAGRKVLERPAFVPATGSELAERFSLAGWTAAEAATRLGVPERTMRRAATYGGRPLPEQVRRALRRYLWSDSL